jgi:hypothetical protein
MIDVSLVPNSKVLLLLKSSDKYEQKVLAVHKLIELVEAFFIAPVLGICLKQEQYQ